MPNTKQDRARIIISTILELDEKVGCVIPAGTVISRFVQTEPRWHARLTAGQRITIGRLNEYEVGERRLSDVGWRLLELQVRDRIVLVANLRGSEIHLHSYVPGIWESWFGADYGGDTALLDPWIFANPRSAEWQVFLQSADYLLPPQRDVPSEGKIGDNPFRRASSRRKRLG